MAVLSYAELFEGKHEIVCSATPEGLEVRPTGDSRSTGLFATRWFRRGDLLYAGEALLLPDEPGSLVCTPLAAATARSTLSRTARWTTQWVSATFTRASTGT